MDQSALNSAIVELLSHVRSYNPNANLPIIEKAIRFAARIHQGQFRESGEEHFMHDFLTGMILAELKLDSHTIAAGILHDTIEYGVKPELLEKEFDIETLELIKAVTKLKLVGKKISFEEEQARRAENLRKIILATAKDIRVILIKLADRLNNMRTLKYLPDDKRRIIARETMDIYAPIAHKLGMYNMKAELEDWSFRFLEPELYQEIKQKVASKKEQREKEVARIIAYVKEELRKEGIQADVHGRAKHFYSIYRKLIKENKQFDEIYDLIAIRIITENVNDCYKALGIVHKLWTPMPDRLKDYIAVPKPNGYQSLHTGVIISAGKVLEVQIRDKAMHRAAEEGIASHWRYKGDDQDKKFDRHIEWLKQVLEWKRSNDAQEFIESLKVDLFQKEIFVFTPKGDPISLPEEATPVDFAYAVHTDIGNHCKQAKVNGSIVPLDYTLSPGDIVEIITVKSPTPSRAWLSFVKSVHTKLKIKHALNIEVDRPKKDKDDDVPLAGHGFDDEVVHAGKKYGLKVPLCCNPQPGDKIRSFKTKDGKIVVHKVGCPNIYSCDLSKEVQLEFKEPEKETVCIKVEVNDRLGILAEMLTRIAHYRHHLSSVNTKFGKEGRVLITMEIVKTEQTDIEGIIQGLKSIEGVNNAYLLE